MGGYGSGNRLQTRQSAVEEFPRIDIHVLNRLGMFSGIAYYRYRWVRGDEPSGSVDLECRPTWVEIRHRYSLNGGPWEVIRQRVNVQYSDCHFGGRRPWFTCPSCSRRIALLVGAGKYFRCRQCYDLPYFCQQEGKADRAARRLRKIQRRLKDPDWENTIELCLLKPERMRWATYERILAQAERPINVLREEFSSIRTLAAKADHYAADKTISSSS